MSDKQYEADRYAASNLCVDEIIQFIQANRVLKNRGDQWKIISDERQEKINRLEEKLRVVVNNMNVRQSITDTRIEAFGISKELLTQTCKSLRDEVKALQAESVKQSDVIERRDAQIRRLTDSGRSFCADTAPIKAAGTEKSILVEAVTRGYIVRPFSPCQWRDGVSMSDRVWMAQTVDGLCKLIPGIIKEPA